MVEVPDATEASPTAQSSTSRELLPPQGAHDEELPPPQSAHDEDLHENDDLGQLLDALAQCTAQAITFREGDQPSRAIRQMERAVRMCQGREQAHPALAVEAARARLNLGSMLSWGGRHVEAVEVIKVAQHRLASVVAWAEDCSPNDPGVTAIAAEAGALQCAALVAEGIELEPFSGGVGGGSSLTSPGGVERRQRKGMHEELYAEAKALAKDRLPPSHPLTSLANRLSEESAVCAQLAAAETRAGVRQSVGGFAQGRLAAGNRISMLATGSGSLVLPPVREQGMGSGKGELSVSSPMGADSGTEEPTTPGGLLWSERGSSTAKAPGDPSSASRNGLAVRRQRTNASTSTIGRTHGRTGSGGGQAKGERHDVFAEFLRGAELEKEARLGPLHDTMQEETRKRLSQVHRTTRLQLELLDDDELRDKRYTRAGHKVFMRNLMRDNHCRSDPSLLTEARKLGESPELAQVRKLHRQLYIPPRTPEPAKMVTKVSPPEPEFLKDAASPAFRRSVQMYQVPEYF